MKSRVVRVAIWALGAVLALSGLSFAQTSGVLGSDPDDGALVLSEDQILVLDEGELDEGENVGEIEEDGGPPAGTGPVWSTEGCPDGFRGNHGRYVSGVEDTGEARSAAARSPCGKPVQAGTGNGDGEDNGKRKGNGQGNGEGHGPSEGQGGREFGQQRASEASGSRSGAGAGDDK